MGNGLSPCCYCPSPTSTRIIFWGGASQLIQARCQASDIMRKLPGYVVCHGDSFYIGFPIPVLSIGDVLLPGQTYFVLPVDWISYDQALTVASLSYLSPDRNTKPTLVGSNPCPFEHLNNEDGSILIRVLPEFVERVITSGSGKKAKIAGAVGGGGVICSTPELQKHYAQLVGPRDRQWSPRLETIKENSKSKERPGRLSPAKLFGFQTTVKEDVTEWRADEANVDKNESTLYIDAIGGSSRGRLRGFGSVLDDKLPTATTRAKATRAPSSVSGVTNNGSAKTYTDEEVAAILAQERDHRLHEEREERKRMEAENNFMFKQLFAIVGVQRPNFEGRGPTTLPQPHEGASGMPNAISQGLGADFIESNERGAFQALLNAQSGQEVATCQAALNQWFGEENENNRPF